MIQRFFPFLAWFPPKPGQVKSDLIAGITVALVLIPQSMAYAQLAGLPAYYGLYAAFLPVMVASMWGSSAQLGTGPVAVVSLLTASLTGSQSVCSVRSPLDQSHPYSVRDRPLGVLVAKALARLRSGQSEHRAYRSR